MASKNLETLRSVHESWNRRDFAGIVRNATEGPCLHPQLPGVSH